MGPLEGPIPTSATKKPGWQRVLKGKGKRQPTRPEPARHTGRIAARGGCCAVARSQSLPSRPPSATAGGPVRGRQSGLRSGPRAGRQRQPRGAPRPATGEMTRGLVHRWCRPGSPRGRPRMRWPMLVPYAGNARTVLPSAVFPGMVAPRNGRWWECRLTSSYPCLR
jgi:hypothetical protein